MKLDSLASRLEGPTGNRGDSSIILDADFRADIVNALASGEERGHTESPCRTLGNRAGSTRRPSDASPRIQISRGPLQSDTKATVDARSDESKLLTCRRLPESTSAGRARLGGLLSAGKEGISRDVAYPFVHKTNTSLLRSGEQ